MPEYDTKAELAPRDVVARAIVDRMAKTDADHVLLDVTHLERSHVVARFPQIYRFCLGAGLDITREPIPVSPAAHYTMGGIRTNVWGETTVPGLYACGECACTGVHGANRLASNSLLETVVFAQRVVQRSVESPSGSAPPSPEARELSEPVTAEAGSPTKEAVQSRMWEDAGILRDAQGLRRAKAALAAWGGSSEGEHAPTGREDVELRDLLLCSRLVAEAALLREESRGAHYRTDFRESREEWRRHIVFRRE
jgi:L-aspartate oxidase